MRELDGMSCEEDLSSTRIVHDGSMHAVSQFFARSLLAKNKRKFSIFLHEQWKFVPRYERTDLSDQFFLSAL